MDDLDSETIRRQDRGGMSGLPDVWSEADGRYLVPCPDHPTVPAVDCEECEPVDSAEPRTTEQRYKAAVVALRASGVTVRVNVRSCCRGCATPEQLGTTADMASNDPHAWTFGGQGGVVSWRDGEAYAGRGYRRFLRQAYAGRPWQITPKRLAPYRAKSLHWYHGGPGVEAAEKVSAAFTAQGFEVEWNGTTEQAVVVKLPLPEGDR